MSKDLTQKLNGSLEDKVDRLITIVESMDSRLRSVEDRLGNVEDRLGNVEDRLGNVEDRLGNVENRLGNVEDRLGNVEDRLGNVEDRLGNVEDRLGNVETKIEERLKDTRPMWEAVQAQLTEVESSLRGEIEALRAQMEKDSRLFDRRMEGYFGEFGKLRAYQRDLEYRVDEIEKKQS